MTVVAAKLNIPGPIKNNKKIESFFIAGLNEFEKMLLDAGIVFISKKSGWIRKPVQNASILLIQEQF